MADIIPADHAQRLEEIDDRRATVRRILAGTTYSRHYGDRMRNELAALEGERAAILKAA